MKNLVILAVDDKDNLFILKQLIRESFLSSRLVFMVICDGAAGMFVSYNLYKADFVRSMLMVLMDFMEKNNAKNS